MTVFAQDALPNRAAHAHTFLQFDRTLGAPERAHDLTIDEPATHCIRAATAFDMVLSDLVIPDAIKAHFDVVRLRVGPSHVIPENVYPLWGPARGPYDARPPLFIPVRAGENVWLYVTKKTRRRVRFIGLITALAKNPIATSVVAAQQSAVGERDRSPSNRVAARKRGAAAGRAGSKGIRSKAPRVRKRRTAKRSAA